jgi:UDP:flavonoid glycosyltransferase YjiC (YdhE family)
MAEGHHPQVVCNPNFCAEADAFGVPNVPLGIDTEAMLRKLRRPASTARATYELFRIGRTRIAPQIDQYLPLARGADVLVGSGLQRSAATVADLLGVPYVRVAFTPQTYRSSTYPPFIFPFTGLPGPVNRLLWSAFDVVNQATFGGPLNEKRRSLGLPPVTSVSAHVYPRNTFLATDPELTPPVPSTASPPFGAFHLPDDRPLGDDIEAFLSRGAPPVYVGFGSMVDPDPKSTTAMVREAAKLAGVRLLLSSGWAGYGEGDASSEDFLVVPSVPHHRLFPRVATVVHHGGAGTTSSAARAGKPQIIVPHLFDQFAWGSSVYEAGLGPHPIARRQLTAPKLAHAIREASAASVRDRATKLAPKLASREPVKAAVAALVRVAGR